MNIYIFSIFTLQTKSQSMSTVKNQKLNKSDVRIGIWKFILSFVILSSVAFFAVFFFFKSYDIQRKGIDKEVKDYTDLLGRSGVLKIQLDNIYDKMDQINDVDNDIILRNQIADDVRNAQSMIGKDSVDQFRHYSALLNKIGVMLALKSKIIDVNNKKQNAIRKLQQCQNNVSHVNKQLSIDPTRNYTGRRR